MKCYGQIFLEILQHSFYVLLILKYNKNAIRSLELDNVYSRDRLATRDNGCLIRGNELQSVRTNCPIRGNELLIRENGLHNSI